MSLIAGHGDAEKGDGAVTGREGEAEYFLGGGRYGRVGVLVVLHVGGAEIGVVDFRGDKRVAGIAERAVELVGFDGLGVVVLEANKIDFLGDVRAVSGIVRRVHARGELVVDLDGELRAAAGREGLINAGPCDGVEPDRDAFVRGNSGFGVTFPIGDALGEVAVLNEAGGRNRRRGWWRGRSWSGGSAGAGEEAGKDDESCEKVLHRCGEVNKPRGGCD
jgi:hypothetical protein